MGWSLEKKNGVKVICSTQNTTEFLKKILLFYNMILAKVAKFMTPLIY